MTFHRYTRSSNSADNGCGYAMFAANEDRVMVYGAHHWIFEGEAVDAALLVEAAREAGFEEAFYSADELNPADIVNSAAAWDDMDAVMWVWENVCEPREWHAIRTQDGVIIFDPALATYAGERETL
jgi:hypothetical protein